AKPSARSGLPGAALTGGGAGVERFVGTGPPPVGQGPREGDDVADGGSSGQQGQWSDDFAVRSGR
ncbi:hypothetical protein NGM37_58785, partial [Streptomyces sp. TRM76130]|nr:hypothetical protein [Streptomyces sp. TRM76130]